MGRGFGGVRSDGEEDLRRLLLRHWREGGMDEGTFLFNRKRKHHLKAVSSWFNEQFEGYLAEYHEGDATSQGFCAIRIVRRRG
jgi:hypothetical protein